WVESANGHPDFPIQNLPFVIFSVRGGKPRGGVVIGEEIVDVGQACAAGLFTGAAADAAEAASGPLLNPLFALGATPRRALRADLSELLAADGRARARVQPMAPVLLHKLTECRLHLPARIGDYTDFFAGIHHATNTGRMLRPDSPLLSNYKHMPIGYHGRASSVVASGAPIQRPHGQRKPGSETEPSFGPSRYLDYELELGIFIGPGNPRGTPIPIGEAEEHIAGLCLLNDWSARDIQAWEYQPLGPFLAKSFASTISPFVVTPEALAPFRIPQPERPAGDPRPLDYLASTQPDAAFHIALEVLIHTAGLKAQGKPPQRLARSNARHLYWTVGQMITHHACGGCNLEPGDLIGTGTISAPTVDGLGSLLELTRGGREPVTLASGETRRFLDDGDEVIMRASCAREGFVSIGFGECRGMIVPQLVAAPI
ncbi:MAG: fumarylacetoacetase, partial [Xanthobacteraceae bacterium]